MAVLDRITVGSQEIIVVDSVPTIGGIVASLGSLILMSDGSASYIKSAVSDTAWTKSVTVDNLSAEITNTTTDASVTGKLLTGFVSGAGTVTASDTILQAFQKLNGNIAGSLTLTSLSATSPLHYNNTTGLFTIQVASSGQPGYLASNDWITFNNKQDTLTFSSGLTYASGAVKLGGVLTHDTYIDNFYKLYIGTNTAIEQFQVVAGVIASDYGSFTTSGTGGTLVAVDAGGNIARVDIFNNGTFGPYSEMRVQDSTNTSYSSISLPTAGLIQIWSTTGLEIQSPSITISGIATTNKILYTGVGGVLAGVTIGTGLSFSGGTLSATGSVGVTSIANGGTNSSTALNNNRIMISSGGAIVEHSALTNKQIAIYNANGLPTGTGNLTFDTAVGLFAKGANSLALQLNHTFKNGNSSTTADVNIYGNGAVTLGATIINSDKLAVNGKIRAYVAGFGAALQIDTGAIIVNSTVSPTAMVDIDASTDTRASLRLRTITTVASPNDGDMWYDTTLKFRQGASTIDVSGTVLSARGGTGFTTYTTGDMIYASAANTLSKLPIGTTGQVLKVVAGVPTWATDTTVGTVTSVSVVTNQGVSGSVATSTTTPAITLTLGALTGVTSINGLVITANTATITTGIWNGTAIVDTYISSAATWNAKQNALSGTGFVKSTAGVISYDTNTYLTANQSITLSGDVAGTGTTAITTAITAATVTGKALTGYVSGAGTVAATDTILQAFQKLNGNIDALNLQTIYSGSTTPEILTDATRGALTIKRGSATDTDALLELQTGAGVTSFSVNGSGNVTAGTWNGGVIGVTYGGTGTATNFTQNSIVFAGASGVYTEDTSFTYNTTTKQLALSGTDTTILMNGITTEPTAPATGNLLLYSKSIAGRMLVKWLGSSGVDNPIQSGIFFNNVSLISPGATTVPSVISCTITNVGTISHPTPTTTNLKAQTRRFVNTMANGAGSLASTRTNVLECWRGNAAGLGGFFVVARFGIESLGTGNRMFVGLTDTANTAPTNIDPTTSTTPGKIGMAINTNTGNWNIVHNITGTAPTVITLSASFPVNTTDLLELVLFAAPNSATVGYRVTNLSNGTQTSGTISTNLPSSTTFMGRTIWMTNNATAGTRSWSCSRFGLETDY